jgi:hypothetical protein
VRLDNLDAAMNKCARRRPTPQRGDTSMRAFFPPICCLPICWLATQTHAAATLFCTVLKSPDGFVALRAAPSPRARLIARMHPGDEVQALEGIRHGWQEVYHWHGLDRFDPAKRGDRRHGWAWSRYISEECG